MEVLKKDDIKIFTVGSGTNSTEIQSLPRYRMWPLVYILYNKTNLYVGETVDIKTRLNNHGNNDSKRALNNKLIITSEYFNKSVTLQLEAYLIEYFSGDGKFRMVNGNLGLTKHNYYNQGFYENVFPEVWRALREFNISQHTIGQIENEDLFKYSPYKSLNLDQQEAIINVLRALRENKENIFIKGGAGTGKTILAIYLMKLLCTPVDEIDPNELDDSFSNEILDLTRDIQILYPDLQNQIALVVPMPPLRKTLAKVFRNVRNLSAKMVVSPTDAGKRSYNILIVDESHRLKRRVNIVNYKSHDDMNKSLNLKNGDELDWILKRSKSRVFFYDKMQSIRPSDILEEKFESILEMPSTISLQLQSQIRSKGGDLYSDFVYNLMYAKLRPAEQFVSDHYEIQLIDKMEDLDKIIKEKNSEYGLARLVAGFAWEWKSKKDRFKHDFEIENIKLRWNGTNIDWINSENAINEVGCIHTTQGYDLNYAGIIFGSEIGYDSVSKKIVVKPENYKDKNGKKGVEQKDLEGFITSIYQTLLLRAIKGTYIYCCDPSLKVYFKEHLTLRPNV